MIPYKTSKDYKRLKELLDEGYHIITFYEILIGDDTCIKKCAFAYRDVGYYLITNFNYYDWQQAHISFEKICEKYNVEFIEPNL